MLGGDFIYVNVAIRTGLRYPGIKKRHRGAVRLKQW